MKQGFQLWSHIILLCFHTSTAKCMNQLVITTNICTTYEATMAFHWASAESKNVIGYGSHTKNFVEFGQHLGHRSQTPSNFPVPPAREGSSLTQPFTGSTLQQPSELVITTMAFHCLPSQLSHRLNNLDTTTVAYFWRPNMSL